MATIQENAEVGVGVIATAPFIREFQDVAWIDRVSTRLNSAGVGLTLVWVRCDASTMHTYLKRRGAARDTGKLTDWNDYIAGIDLDFQPVADHVTIDNSASNEPLQGQATKMLAAVTVAA